MKPKNLMDGIQRYSSSIDELKNGNYVACMEPDSLGAWVKFSDYLKQQSVGELEKEIVDATISYELAFTELCRLYDEDKPFDNIMLMRELAEKALIDLVRKFKDR